MTVSYTSKVTTSTGIGIFVKLLARWKGSVYKIIWLDLIVFLVIYYTLYAVNRFILDDESKTYFKSTVLYCEKYASLIPISFVLGFYVNLVTTRWWSQYCSIPFPDNLAILVGANIKGQDTRAKIVRRTIVRYACVSFTITLTMISPKAKKRFPTLDHFVDAGLITMEEKKIMEDLDKEYPSYSKYWLPLAWASNIVTRARHEGIIRDDDAVQNLLDELNGFRSKCGTLLDYDWISIPLVYTQVVTIAVYSYFLIAVVGNQYIYSEDKPVSIDTYFPLLPVLEFFFYMGWLRVAETLINPFGDDDDDFEVIWMIDRNIQVVYLLVDTIHQVHPYLLRDPHWDMVPNVLNYTKASEKYMQEYPLLSTSDLNVKPADQEIIMAEVGAPVKRGSSLSKLFSDTVRQRVVVKSRRSSELKTVMTKNKRYQSFDEINEYINVEDNSQKKSLTRNDSQFENLKRQRSELHKKKILNALELLKTSGKGEQEKLLDTIVH